MRSDFQQIPTEFAIEIVWRLYHVIQLDIPAINGSGYQAGYPTPELTPIVDLSLPFYLTLTAPKKVTNVKSGYPSIYLEIATYIRGFDVRGQSYKVGKNDF